MKNTLTLVILSLFISTTGFCKGYTIRDNGNGTFDVRCTGSMSWWVGGENNFTKIEFARSMGQKHCIGKIDNVSKFVILKFALTTPRIYKTLGVTL